ncbi:MAG TPA: DUF4191 family protein, partial [Mycobacteriales bacterium]|nr:DUF4191 family protein [Mycobacteriales bacterium]
MALLSRDKKKAGSSKAGRGRGGGKPKPPRGARLQQIRTAWTMTRRADPKVLPLTLAAFLGPLLLLIAVGLVVGPLYLWVPLALLVALLVTT